MGRYCCVLLLLALPAFCFAQEGAVGEESPFTEEGIQSAEELPAEKGSLFKFEGDLDFSPKSGVYRTVSAEEQNQSIFANAPLWVKDLRRGEIVFFGSFPFTVFFSRTIVDLVRMGQNGWDRRYAPWPFQSAGGVQMDKNQIILTFSVAASASLVIAVIDHLLVRNKRKAAGIGNE